MPFYAYNCNNCKKTFKVFHSPEENQDKCIVCPSTDIKKIIATVRTISENTPKTSAGARVERFIEESRETLREQLQEARKELK